MPSSATRENQTALIFEGGGMRASYTSAVVVSLLQAGITFDWVAGISAGASNAANYLSRDAKRARRCFVDFAADPQFGNMRTFLRGQGLFNAEYIYQQTGLPNQALPFDWHTFNDNPTQLNIAAFDVHSGHTTVWTRQDISQMNDLMIRVQASSTMPVLMPPVTIAGRTYVDGALGEDGGVALSIAEAAGLSRFFVVLTQPRDYFRKPERFPTFYRRYLRKYPAVADALITRWQRYNDTKERLLALEKEGRAYLFVPEHMPVSNGERSLAKLAAAHRAGLSQARRELGAWKEFLAV